MEALNNYKKRRPQLNFEEMGIPAKYDIRSWDPEHNKMGKGVTFTKAELAELKRLLDSMDLEH